jgi:hypothetical protein
MGVVQDAIPQHGVIDGESPLGDLSGPGSM